MRDPDLKKIDVRNPFATYLLGFLGVIFVFKVLPRALRFMGKRFFVGILGEIVAVVITGLLTEKAVEALNDRND